MASEWFFRKDGRNYGPISSVVLRQLADGGILLPRDLVLKRGVTGWAKARDVRNLWPANATGKTDSSTEHPVPTRQAVKPAQRQETLLARAFDPTQAYVNSDSVDAIVDESQSDGLEHPIGQPGPADSGLQAKTKPGSSHDPIAVLLEGKRPAEPLALSEDAPFTDLAAPSGQVPHRQR